MVDSGAHSVAVESWNGTDQPSDRKTDSGPSRTASPTRALTLKYSSDEEPRKKEWASTLLLVQEACEAIKTSEERVEGLERELEMAAFQAREEQRQLSSKLSAAQDEVVVANARAKAFETRAQDAEAWLRRLNDAIVEGLGKKGTAEGK